MLLNRLKGSEMSVTTYVGFSIVSLMCIALAGALRSTLWSCAGRWVRGLRNTIVMSDATSFGHLLDNFLSFSIGGFTVPTGLLLFMALCCYVVWLFMRSRTGVAMTAVGNNPPVRRGDPASTVDRMRIVGTMISTMLGAIGILVYSQSYGFMQLYTAPRQMGFVAGVRDPDRRRVDLALQDQPRADRHVPVPRRADAGNAGGERAGSAIDDFGNDAHSDLQRHHTLRADQVGR